MSSDSISQPVIILAGPTAIGKTELSLQLALRFNCEIISVDSMQVYKYMDIGTAKILQKERAGIPHHLIDIRDPDENYDAVQFARDAITAIQTIHQKGKVPLLTGGTGLYFKALIDGIFPGVASDSGLRKQLQKRLESEGAHALHAELSGYDTGSAARIHQNDTHRLLRALEIFHLTGKPWSAFCDSENEGVNRVKLTRTLQIALECPRSTLYERINMRTEKMLRQGLEKEVRNLLQMGYDRDLKSMRSIGYRHMANFVFGNWSYEDMRRLLARDTRRYAKRQFTWFSKMKNMIWIKVDDIGRTNGIIEKWLDAA